MENFKLKAIKQQKKIVTTLKENFSSESSRENEIKKLNFIIDDYEKDNSLITKDNIHLYYEFMNIEKLLKNRNLIFSIICERFEKIKDILNYCEDLIYRKDNNIILLETIDNFTVSFSIFGIKDTLKPINEFIEEIKQSKKYEEHKKEIFLINGKSKEASNVLKLLDNDYSYKEAMEKTLQSFKNISKRDLEIELDIYI